MNRLLPSRVSQPVLRVSQPALRVSQPVLRVSQPVLRVSQPVPGRSRFIGELLSSHSNQLEGASVDALGAESAVGPTPSDTLPPPRNTRSCGRSSGMSDLRNRAMMSNSRSLFTLPTS